MKRILVILFLMMSLQTSAQSDFDKSVDAENGSTVYKGQFSFGELQREPGFGWFKSGVEAYKPDSVTVSKLQNGLKNYKLVIVMGTWCDDSQVLVPKLYKTLIAAGYPMSQVRLYGVDRNKEMKYEEHRFYKIEKVPTIIVYRSHTEMGRIVEVTKQSVEKDLAAIIGVAN